MPAFNYIPAIPSSETIQSAMQSVVAQSPEALRKAKEQGPDFYRKMKARQIIAPAELPDAEDLVNSKKSRIMRIALLLDAYLQAPWKYTKAASDRRDALKTVILQSIGARLR